MLSTAACAVKRERFYREIGDFIIQFGLVYVLRKGVIVHGGKEVWKFRKDVKDSKDSSKKDNNNKKEVSKEIMNSIHQLK